MPTFVEDVNDKQNRSSVKLSEDEHEEYVAYETVEDIEIEDTNSFVS